MNGHRKPYWKALVLIGVVFAVALVMEAPLPFSPSADAWLLVFWVLLFHGAIAVWITQNRDALEREPQPLDCIGRPIIDNGASEFEAEPDNHPSPVYGATRSLNRSEVI